MSPLGHSTIEHPGAESGIAASVADYGTVTLWGEASDAIQVSGDVEGCGTYETSEGRFRLFGEVGSVDVGLRYSKDASVWTWRAEADLSGTTLPIAITYEPTTAVIAVENVSRVVKI